MSTEIERIGNLAAPVAAVKGAIAPAGKDLYRLIFNQNFENKDFKPLISGNISYEIQNITSLQRAGTDLIQSTDPALLGSIGFTGPAASVTYQAFGTSSLLNAVIWGLQMPSSFNQIAFSDKIGDKRQALTGRISVVKNAVGITAALSLSGGFRVTSIMGAAQGATPSSLLGRLSFGFVTAGLVLYSIFFALISIVVGISIYEGEKLRKDLTLEKLVRKLTVDPAKIKGKFKGAELEKEALSVGMQQLKALSKELGIKADDKVFEGALIQLAGGKDKLEEIGLALKLAQIQCKKEQKLLRTVGKECFDEIQKLVNGKLDSNAQALLVDKVRASLNSNLRMNIIVLAVCLLSIAALVAGIVCTAGVPLIIASVLMVASTLAMIGLDGYCFKMSLEGEQPATHDKKAIVFSTVVCIAAVVTLVALHVFGIVTFGVGPLVVALVLAGMWLGYNYYVWNKLDEKEHNQRLTKPTLETFAEDINSYRFTDEQIEEMFEKLPEKKQIKAALTGDSRYDYFQATNAVIEDLKALKAEELERIREALVPYLVRETDEHDASS